MITNLCLLGLGFALGSIREILIKRDEIEEIKMYYNIEELD
ncbi:MAG: hypothetical protein ACRCX2_04270 [Paraclostridium sp.]